MGNISGFEKKHDREAEEIREIAALQAILTPAEFGLVMAFRELKPLSTMKVALQQNGKAADILITHSRRMPLDGKDAGARL